MKATKWIAIVVIAAGTTLVSGAQDAAAKPHPDGHVHKLGPASTTLTVTVDGKAKQFTMADLQAMPQEDVTVFDKRAKRDMVWSGPSLATIFAASGMPFNAETEREILRKYVVATGTDGYMVVSSAGELIEAFSGISSIIAIKRDGQPLGPIGEFALFNNQDKMPARHVSNLVTLEVKTAGH